VHAYVLMPNHVHLLVTPHEPENISRTMRRLGQRYVQHFNKAHGRSGAMWEGRFKSIPVDSELYLLRCQRYIEQNPVRAEIASHPRDYPWSSYRHNADGWISAMIKPHSVFTAMVGEDRRHARIYQEFLAERPDERELKAIRGGATFAGVRARAAGCVPGVRPRGASPGCVPGLSRPGDLEAGHLDVADRGGERVDGHGPVEARAPCERHLA
jgi:putative transposase